jgi:hypothetical protein
MLSRKTKAKAGAKGTWMLVKHPTLRRATVSPAKPSAKVGWKLKGRGTQETAKKRVLPALAIGIAIVAVVLLELGWARRRKAAHEAEGEPEISTESEPLTPGPTPAAGTPQ